MCMYNFSLLDGFFVFVCIFGHYGYRPSEHVGVLRNLPAYGPLSVNPMTVSSGKMDALQYVSSVCNRCRHLDRC